MNSGRVTVVGGGLAGSEAAWQLAQQGLEVELFEMRPKLATGAHVTADLAELVCSNSLGSQLQDRASGMLMHELGQLGSLLIRVAKAHAVPAGSALAVDRTGFSQAVTQELQRHPNIQIRRQEVRQIPDGVAVVATGPLTSEAMAGSLQRLTGSQHLYFFDAISPIVEVESIDFAVAFRASRYGRGEMEQGDYINCPLNEAEYRVFVTELKSAERIELREFEQELKQGVRAGMHQYFEGCLPVEVIAERGEQALAFGPMRPVGLIDPRRGEQPFAVVQLRQDDLAGNLFNLVGFQTNLRFPEQRRVFRLIPGLAQAEFARYGQMHRNTFINAPSVLTPSLQVVGRPSLYLAGQITGVEGYLGNIATGWLAGMNAARSWRGESPWQLPPETMLGALCAYISGAEPEHFQPMKANMGILPGLGQPRPRNKRGRAAAYAARGRAVLSQFMREHNAYSHYKI
jgi:methylenetetrahydrofolate--tRNA-(uracil-5-)-methyltransferase